MSGFQASKGWLIESSQLSRDMAHSLIGLLLLLSVLFVRRSRPTWSCIIPTVVIALAGECLDLWDQFRYARPYRLANAASDIVFTVAPALVILAAVLLGVRWRQSLQEGER